MSNLYVFVISSWELSELVIPGDFCDGLLLSLSLLLGVRLRRSDG